ncbi:DNA replication initiation control protein YabA [Lactococcus fujiensis]|uniref:DNA replication initiation control protein YabA n=1 Tax=Lactococcus fujiensis TaxID=610251 RepID=UPI000BDF09DD|nr:initiation control protein YabA [Lactococcus fujiensis]
MADKKEILEQLNILEDALNQTLAQVSSIRQKLEDSQRENATLRMELEKVREHLAELEKHEVQETTSTSDEPNPTLINIFNEGFHVCHLHYAERLDEGESCLDCLELLYR